MRIVTLRLMIKNGSEYEIYSDLTGWHVSMIFDGYMNKPVHRDFDEYEFKDCKEAYNFVQYIEDSI